MSEKAKPQEGRGAVASEAPGPALVQVDSLRTGGDEGTCLRPLGLCELGGCCDVCWYSPKHPRFRDK